MRICYISHSNSHFTRPYVDYFSRQGHDVHLVSLYGANLPNAVNHHPLAKPFDPEVQKLSYLWALPKVRTIVKSLRPCIVHAHYVSSNGCLAAFSDVHPFVVSARGSDLHDAWNPIRRAATRYALARADLVNPVSRCFERKLLSLGVPTEKMLTLTQGVDTARFGTNRSCRSPGPVRLLCTRSLSAHYNCFRIVRALSILKGRSVPFHFTFAAGGPEEAFLRREVARRGLTENVTFLGGYGQDELPPMLGQADVYVSATAFDGASISLLEAMASGLFPVVSDIPGNREWLTGHGDSLLFDPADERQLANCLSSAIQDNGLRQRAIQVNRQQVKLRGEREKNLAVLSESYQILIDTFKR